MSLDISWADELRATARILSEALTRYQRALPRRPMGIEERDATDGLVSAALRVSLAASGLDAAEAVDESEERAAKMERRVDEHADRMADLEGGR